MPEGEPPGSPLEIDLKGDGGDVVIFLRGDIDPHTAPMVFAAVKEALAGTKTLVRLVLDVAAVEFIDSSGLRALLQSRSATKGAGLELVLRSPNATLQRLLDITRLTEEFVLES